MPRVSEQIRYLESQIGVASNTYDTFDYIAGSEAYYEAARVKKRLEVCKTVLESAKKFIEIGTDQECFNDLTPKERKEYEVSYWGSSLFGWGIKNEPNMWQKTAILSARRDALFRGEYARTAKYEDNIFSCITQSDWELIGKEMYLAKKFPGKYDGGNEAKKIIFDKILVHYNARILQLRDYRKRTQARDERSFGSSSSSSEEDSKAKSRALEKIDEDIEKCERLINGFNAFRWEPEKAFTHISDSVYAQEIGRDYNFDPLMAVAEAMYDRVKVEYGKDYEEEYLESRKACIDDLKGKMQAWMSKSTGYVGEGDRELDCSGWVREALKSVVIQKWDGSFYIMFGDKEIQVDITISKETGLFEDYFLNSIHKDIIKSAEFDLKIEGNVDKFLEIDRNNKLQFSEIFDKILEESTVEDIITRYSDSRVVRHGSGHFHDENTIINQWTVLIDKIEKEAKDKGIFAKREFIEKYVSEKNLFSTKLKEAFGKVDDAVETYLGLSKDVGLTSSKQEAAEALAKLLGITVKDLGSIGKGEETLYDKILESLSARRYGDIEKQIKECLPEGRIFGKEVKEFIESSVNYAIYDDGNYRVRIPENYTGEFEWADTVDLNTAFEKRIETLSTNALKKRKEEIIEAVTGEIDNIEIFTSMKACMDSIDATVRKTLYNGHKVRQSFVDEIEQSLMTPEFVESLINRVDHDAFFKELEEAYLNPEMGYDPLLLNHLVENKVDEYLGTISKGFFELKDPEELRNRFIKRHQDKIFALECEKIRELLDKQAEEFESRYKEITGKTWSETLAPGIPVGVSTLSAARIGWTFGGPPGAILGALVGGISGMLSPKKSAVIFAAGALANEGARWAYGDEVVNKAVFSAGEQAIDYAKSGAKQVGGLAKEAVTFAAGHADWKSFVVAAVAAGVVGQFVTKEHIEKIYNFVTSTLYAALLPITEPIKNLLKGEHGGDIKKIMVSLLTVSAAVAAIFLAPVYFPMAVYGITPFTCAYIASFSTFHFFNNAVPELKKKHKKSEIEHLSPEEDRKIHELTETLKSNGIDEENAKAVSTLMVMGQHENKILQDLSDLMTEMKERGRKPEECAKAMYALMEKFVAKLAKEIGPNDENIEKIQEHVKVLQGLENHVVQALIEIPETPESMKRLESLSGMLGSAADHITPKHEPDELDLGKGKKLRKK